MGSNIKPTVGMKVHAVVVGSDGDIVHGTITNVEPLIVEETDEVLSEHFPTITLDDGRIVNGMECWWSPVDEEIGRDNMKTAKECFETGCADCIGCEIGPTTTIFNEECYFYSTLEKRKKELRKHKDLRENNIVEVKRMTTTQYKIDKTWYGEHGEEVNFTGVIELNDVVIAAVDDEWRKHFYGLNTPQDVAEHIAFNIIMNKTHLSMLDGFADLPDDYAVLK